MKNPEIHYRKKKTSSANDARLTVCLPIEECNWIHIYHPVHNSSTSGLKTLAYKTGYTEPDTRECRGKTLKTNLLIKPY